MQWKTTRWFSVIHLYKYFFVLAISNGSFIENVSANRLTTIYIELLCTFICGLNFKHAPVL
jgi:hypothetical protein